MKSLILCIVSVRKSRYLTIVSTLLIIKIIDSFQTLPVPNSDAVNLPNHQPNLHSPGEVLPGLLHLCVEALNGGPVTGEERALR